MSNLQTENMPDAEPVEQLFLQWKGGCADSGQQMADRFSLWFAALIGAARGEQGGRLILEHTCAAFSREIEQIAEPDTLLPWATGLVQAGLARDPQPPAPPLPKVQLRLREALGALPPEQMQLLMQSYGPEPKEIEDDTQDHLLALRTALRQRLAEAGATMSGLGQPVDLDSLPLPIYEAGRMACPAERAAVERWLLNRPGLCQQMRELAPYTAALRNEGRNLLRPESTRAAPESQSTSPSTWLAMVLLLGGALLFWFLH